jgi:hypothetical protein
MKASSGHWLGILVWIYHARGVGNVANVVRENSVRHLAHCSLGYEKQHTCCRSFMLSAWITVDN